jgi:hypothetical protein
MSLSLYRKYGPIGIGKSLRSIGHCPKWRIFAASLPWQFIGNPVLKNPAYISFK